MNSLDSTTPICCKVNFTPGGCSFRVEYISMVYWKEPNYSVFAMNLHIFCFDLLIKRVKVLCLWKERGQGYFTKIKHYFWCENEGDTKLVVNILWDIIYQYIMRYYDISKYTCINRNKDNLKTFTVLSTAESMTSNTARTISWKSWNSLVEYSSWEYELDIKKFDGNMFNPIFLKKHLSGLVIAEPKLYNSRKTQSVVQKEWHGH